MSKLGWPRSARNASFIEAQIRRNMIVAFGLIMVIVTIIVTTLFCS